MIIPPVDLNVTAPGLNNCSNSYDIEKTIARTPYLERSCTDRIRCIHPLIHNSSRASDFLVGTRGLQVDGTRQLVRSSRGRGVWNGFMGGIGS